MDTSVVKQASIADVANYIVWFGQEYGDPVTHLKLQKLCYYVEAYHLAIYDKAFTGSRFEAWPHGPVSPAVYHTYKSNSWHPIVDEMEKPGLQPHVEEHIDDVLTAYFGFGAYQLEQMTHLEEPWIEARAGLPPDAACSTRIDPEKMRTYYKKFLDNGA